jgi:FkbM family methyltransferase
VTVEETIHGPPEALRRRKSARPALNFFRDVEPFFLGEPIRYVDAGAHRGTVFATLVDSGLVLGEAHLIEPNPRAFAALEETVARLAPEAPVHCHARALDRAPGRLRLHESDTMTRVIGAGMAEPTPAPEDLRPGDVFEVEATTLDALAGGFDKPQIGILKIDVEGHEANVLAGAAHLLETQAIDLIYLEVGLDPEGTQQSYYRPLEDRLRSHGYRLFRVYEQKNEWIVDSPLLRRANFAFMAGNFATRRPYRLSRALLAARREVNQLGTLHQAGQKTRTTLEARLEEREVAIAALREQVEAERRAREEAIAALQEQAEAEQRAREEAIAALREQAAERAKSERRAREAAQDAEAALRREHEALLRYARELERRHQDMLGSETWLAMEPIRRTIRFLTGKRPPKPFRPQLSDRWAGGARPAPKSSAKTSAKRETNADGHAEQLVTLANRRDYPALLSYHTKFAESEQLDASFFLCRFARLLALKRLSAFDAAVAIHDEIAGRFGKKGDWLLGAFGANTYQRYVIDASTALSRVGRRDAALALIDDALPRLKAPAALLQHRAEFLWPYDPAAARADLAAAAAKDALKSPYLLLGAYLDMCASGPGSEVTLAAQLDAHPQMGLVAAAAAATCGDYATYRRWLNQHFAAQGLREPLPPEAERFAFEALDPGGEVSRDGPLVSVVMTTFNSAATLGYALGSIRGQTHGALEVLVVDDGSADGTRALLAEMAAADPRIRILLNEENVGTYVAKNRAIAEAQGVYVTLHDSDDWAHPERIARHVAAMETTPILAATRSEWLRLDPSGRPQFRRWGAKFQHPNPASTFLRRSAIEAAGYFDSVRYGADSEYWFRLNRLFPGRAKGLPLCLGLGAIRAESLTQSGVGAMDVENYAPTRGAYAAAYLDWHVTTHPATLKLPPRLSQRPFPAPAEMVVPPPADTSQSASAHPEFMFGISLASAQVSTDWVRTQELLGHTLRSLLNQSDPRFTVVICGHERPCLPEIDDPRVLFVESDRPPPKNSSGFRGDKMRKRRIIGSILRARGGGYFFPLDADDLVHRDVVAHVRTGDNRKGYLIEKGYVLDYANQVLGTIPGAWSVSFDRSCGSSAVIWFTADELPIDGENDPELYFNLFQSHAYWPLVAEEFGRRLDPLPFAGGVYVVNHAQNLSFRLQRKGVRTENIVRAISAHRVENATAILGNNFGYAFRAAATANRPAQEAAS